MGHGKSASWRFTNNIIDYSSARKLSASTVNILAYYVHEVFGLDFVDDSQWDELLFALHPPSGAVDPLADEDIPMLCRRTAR